MGRITDVVKALLIINVIVFVGTLGLPDDVRRMGSVFFPLSDQFKPFQIITCMFLHGDFQHLLFNMLTLFFLGPIVEQTLGPKRFLQLYFVSGIGATFINMAIQFISYTQLSDGIDPATIQGLMDGSITSMVRDANFEAYVALSQLGNIGSLGASGAIYGVLIAFATLYPNMKLMLLFPPIPVAAKYMAVGLVLIGVFSGVSGTNDGIGHWAHVGGAVIGFLMIKFYWKMANLR